MLYLDKNIQDLRTSVFIKLLPTKKINQLLMSAEEVGQVLPGHPRRRFVFSFHGDRALRVDYAVAKYLLKKYPKDVCIMDRHTGNAVRPVDDLTNMKFQQLVQLLARYNRVAKSKGMVVRPFSGRREDVEDWIREYRELGLKVDEDDEDEI